MAKKSKTLEQRVEETLKFEPVTYTIDLYGWGGELVIGTVEPKVYEYFQDNDLDIAEYAHDWDYADENEIPDDMQPFEPGVWHECDNICHESGIALGDSNWIRVLDEKENIVLESTLEADSLEKHGIETEETEEIYVNELPEGTCVFIGQSVEKGTFDGYKLHLTAPFDPSKLKINYGDYEGWPLVGSVTYADEPLDSLGNISTDGKSSDYQLIRVGDDD
jgi:hypothetical protein